jgi:hypothetical protein
MYLQDLYRCDWKYKMKEEERIPKGKRSKDAR